MTADRRTDDPDASDDPPAERSALWEAAANALRPYVGWLFIGFGALFILIGYLGISRESLVAKQLPYLISGGVGGVLLAIVGAYFLGVDQLRRDSGRLDRIEQQVDDLHRLLLERPDAPHLTTDDGTAAPEPVPANGRVVVVAAGESFHRPECALVAGKDVVDRFDPDVAAAEGLRSCPVCEPADAT